MKVGRVAAVLYAVISAGVVVFQLCLVAGAPWGAYAMGGVSPGRFSVALRIAALVQASLIAIMAMIVVAHAGIVRARWLGAWPRLVWIVVAFSAVSLVLNLLSPSSGERLLWAPVALLLLVTSTAVAVQGVSRGLKTG